MFMLTTLENKNCLSESLCFTAIINIMQNNAKNLIISLIPNICICFYFFLIVPVGMALLLIILFITFKAYLPDKH